MRAGFSPWVGKIPWRKEQLPTPVFWPGESHGLYSPWSHKATSTFQTGLTPGLCWELFLVLKWFRSVLCLKHHGSLSSLVCLFQFWWTEYVSKLPSTQEHQSHSSSEQTAPTKPSPNLIHLLPCPQIHFNPLNFSHSCLLPILLWLSEYFSLNQFKCFA